MARSPVMWTCFCEDSKHAAGVCLGTVQARTFFQVHLHVGGRRYALNTSYGLPCNTCADKVGIWVMNVPIMLLHLVHLASFPATTLPLAGFVKTLTRLLVVMVVTTWRDYVKIASHENKIPQDGSQ